MLVSKLLTSDRTVNDIRFDTTKGRHMEPDHQMALMAPYPHHLSAHSSLLAWPPPYARVGRAVAWAARLVSSCSMIPPSIAAGTSSVCPHCGTSRTAWMRLCRRLGSGSSFRLSDVSGGSPSNKVAQRCRHLTRNRSYSSAAEALY